MTERIEFGSKDLADEYREEYEEHLCSDDDRRLKTVAFASTTPEHVLEQATVDAAASIDDRRGPGQAPLTPGERSRFDFSRENANIPWARAVKAIFLEEGVDDWTAYADPTLSVDEHRQLARRAARDERGARLDSEPDATERLAATEGLDDARCKHASTHCSDGDTDACDFLTDECGLDEDEVQALLSDFDVDDVPADEIDGKWLGALRRAWNGYHGATDALEEAIDDAREAYRHAEAAAKAINGIRQAHGQEEIEEFRDLEEGLTKLAAAGTTATIDVDAGDQEASDDLPLADDRHLEDDVDADGTLFDHARNAPDEGRETASREHRAAQQEGYLRQGEGDDVDERDGLGQYGARRSDTRGLEEYEDA